MYASHKLNSCLCKYAQDWKPKLTMTVWKWLWAYKNTYSKANQNEAI